MNLARINEWFLAVLFSWLVMSHFVTVSDSTSVNLIVGLTIVFTIITGIAALIQKFGDV